MTEKEEDLLSDFKDDFSTFIEAGFMAVDQKDEKSAKELFYAAQILNPSHPAPKVGLGYIELNKLQIKEAEKLLKEVLEVDPDHHLAKSFLGIAYLLRDETRKDGEKLIKDAMKKTDDRTVKDLGKVSLEWAEKDLKKRPAPFFAQEDEEETSSTEESK